MSPESAADYYPLHLESILKEKPWGGRVLVPISHKRLRRDVKIGEAWGAWEGCRIANGPRRGAALAKLLSADPRGMLGAAQDGGQLPLLFKTIDAREALSVQVHPDDAQARALEQEPRGKTEAWCVLHAEPGATLVHGFARDTDEAGVRDALAQNRLPDLLAFVPVAAGDVFFVPAGLVHAIGGGIVLAEIQQNSDTTYRFFDWNRRDAQGNPRALHVEQSLRVADFRASGAHRVTPLALSGGAFERHVLVACRYFALERWRVPSADTLLPPASGFRILNLLAGAARFAGGGETVEVAAGHTLLLPAALHECRVEPASPACELLCAYVPELENDVIAPLRRAGHPAAAIAQLGGSDARRNDLAPLLAGAAAAP